MQYPTLAKVKFRDDPYNGLHQEPFSMSIPTIRFTSHPEWLRTKFEYTIKNGETVIAVQEQLHNYGYYSYNREVCILPLIPILMGTTKKAAIKWKHCKAYYPVFQMLELTYLDGTPWISAEQIRKEEDEYHEKIRQRRDAYNYAPVVAENWNFVMQNQALPQGFDDINLEHDEPADFGEIRPIGHPLRGRE